MVSSKGIYTSEANRAWLERTLTAGLNLYIPKFDGPPHLDDLFIERLVGYLFYQSEPMTIQPDESKVIATLLKQTLTAYGFKITHTKCLEITSHLYGCNNWNELAKW